MVFFPQGWSVGVHVRAEGRGFAVIAVAGGALVAVDLRAGDKGGLVGLDGGSLEQFAIDAGGQSAMGYRSFLGEWSVGYSNGQVAET
jgi:hypothetical protein